MTLVFLGNTALRRVSKSVADVQAPAIRRLLESMEKEVVRAHSNLLAMVPDILVLMLSCPPPFLQQQEAGVGIAAPQLAHNLRMFLMIKTMPDNEDDLSKLEYQEVLNPEIVAMSDSVKRDFEGCLSVPGYQAIVKRAQKVRVQYEDGNGCQIQQTLTDFPARVFQHELDHLNGVMYLDRMEPGSLIHNEEFETMEWIDIQQMLLQEPPQIPPLMAPTLPTETRRQRTNKGNHKNKY